MKEPCRNRWMRLGIALLSLWAVSAPGWAATWQYAVSFDTGKTNKNESRITGKAMLWLPPSSKTIRGLLLADGEISQAESVRRACADNDLGIVALRGLIGTFRFWADRNHEAENLLTAMNGLAARTAHKELRRVPWITFGHSTGGITCRNIAYWKPDRVAGVIHYKSGNFHAPNTLPPGNSSLAGVPMLVINGQYETFGPDNVEQPDDIDKRLDKRYGRETQWIYVRSDIQKFRERDPNHLISLMLDLGGDHFHGSPELWASAALFIRKTAQRRIPAELPPGDEPVKCLPVRVETGWLSDADLKEPRHPPAAYADYTGDKVRAFWHYDREMAETNAAHHAHMNGPQVISSPIGAWLDDGDGWTFRVKAEWLDSMPDKYGSSLGGKPVGHSGTPFFYRGKTNEPVEQIGPDTFRLLAPCKKIFIAAVHPGDARFRATHRWGELAMPALKGAAQQIEFPAIPDLKASAGPYELKAKASGGLPVYYTVEYGPVIVNAGKLVISELPVNPPLPIECAVTATQLGRRTEPAVATAAPVTVTFQLIP